MSLPHSYFPVAQTPLVPPRPQVLRWRRILCARGGPKIPLARSLTGRPPIPQATRGPSLSQRHEHGCPAPAHPALGRPVRNLQDLRYLRIGETLHMPQDQRSPVLHPHMPKRSLDLIAALRAQSRRLWVGVPTGRLREVRCLAVVLPLLPARLLLADAEAGVHCDLVEPGAKGALSPEPFYVSPDPDPDLLAGILGILCPEHA